MRRRAPPPQAAGDAGPYYLSPEQAGGERDVDLRADLWALTVTCFECLVGRRPFGGGSLAALVVAITGSATPLPSAAAPELRSPPNLDLFVQRGLCRPRAGRFASALELVQAFSWAAGVPLG